MYLLLADDHPLNRKLLRALLGDEGFEIQEVETGDAALRFLEASRGPVVALLDWEMPGMTGVEVCRAARNFTVVPQFLVLVTVRDGSNDVVEGLKSGAHDYITKPFDNHEVVARVRIARQLLGLQVALNQRVRELQDALAQVKQLSGLLPICSYCHKIRDDEHYWHRVENYIASRTDARFSHGCCPQCFESKMRPYLQG